MTTAGHGFWPITRWVALWAPARHIDVQLGPLLSLNNPFKNITLNAGAELDTSVSKPYKAHRRR